MSRDLREEVARAFYDAPEGIGWDYIADPDVKEWYLACADAALSAARPVIERETREACAKVADDAGKTWSAAAEKLDGNEVLRNHAAAAETIAAAIRSQP